jgi:multiple sugar transport system substrate-binding protein
MRKIAVLMVMSMLILVIASGCSTKSNSNGGQNSTSAGTDANTADSPAATSSASENAASSSGDGKVIELTLWHCYSQEQGKIFDQIVADFNSTHPNIKIKAQYITDQISMQSKLVTALAGDQEPDMAWGGPPTWGPAFSQSGKVADLSDFLKNSKTLNAEGFYPGMLDISSYKGKVFSIPTDGGDYGIFYNKDVFKKAGLDPEAAPQSWDDLIKAAVQIKEKTGMYGFYVPIGNDEWTIYVFQGMLWGNGGTYIDVSADKAKVEFNSEAGVKGLQTWIDLIHKYKVAPSTQSKGVDQAQLLQQGKVAMAVDGPWDVAPLLKAKFPLGTSMFPKGSAGYATNLGTNASYIFKTGDDKVKASWAFTEWFMDPERLAKWDVAANYLPTLTSVEQLPVYQDYLKQYPALKPLVDNLKYATGRPSLLSYTAISAELGPLIEQAIYGRISAKEALDQGAEKAKAILSEHNE